jgi:pimeloyl-ACP methyl ester carboxylesterase
VKALILLICVSFVAAVAFAQGRETYADLAGVRLWYKDTGGSGVPIVFLHANTGSSQNWEHQIPAFTAAGFRVISFDRRGWGRSVAQPGAQAGTAADDLHALMKSLGIDRFHLMGTAGGGFVAFDYALSFPGTTSNSHRGKQHRRRPGRRLLGAGSSAPAASV